MSSEGSFILLKCGFHEIWQKIVLFSFLGHPNGPKTTSHNKVVIMLFGGLLVHKIIALGLNRYLNPVQSCRQQCSECQKSFKKGGRCLNFRWRVGVRGGWIPKFCLFLQRYIQRYTLMEQSTLPDPSPNPRIKAMGQN